MRTSCILFIGIIVIAGFIFYGCSEDDCPDCPSVSQEAFMIGEAQLDGAELEFYGMIFGIDGTMPSIDSVKVEGKLAESTNDYGEFGYGVYVEYDSARGDLVSGDTITVAIYTPGGICYCSVKVLDEDLDEPVIIDWSLSWPYDTIDVNDPLEIDWHPVGNADWYMVKARYNLSSAPDQDTTYFLTDTTVTITNTAHEGEYWLSVYAMTGPTPNTPGGNITGGIVKGYILSSEGDYFDVYIRDLSEPSGNTHPDEDNDRPEENILNILKEIYFQ